jgi:uncharacterized RDD family membrane protein YckC
LAEAEVTSPESVTFRYDVAGVGSRFAALAVDHAIQLVLVLGVLAAATGTLYVDVSVYVPSQARALGVTMWVWAGLVVVTFAILWGYFVFFEMVWGGRTPGKRLFGLRVMRAGGYPVDLAASAVRNLVRYVDALPGPYSVGVVTMFLSGQWQRLGDFAGGTVVVRDRRLEAPEAFRPEGEAGWEQALAAADRVTEQEQRVVREFLRRRGELEAGSREALARRIADPLAEKFGVALGPGVEVRERFLEAVAAALRGRGL